MSAFPITVEDVRAAADVIEGAVERTPIRLSRTLSEIAGCEIWLKFENLQFTASFKDRGALNKLKSLSAQERERGVIAMSAGNHAQGVAYHAGRLGIPATTRASFSYFNTREEIDALVSGILKVQEIFK